MRRLEGLTAFATAGALAISGCNSARNNSSESRYGPGLDCKQGGDATYSIHLLSQGEKLRIEDIVFESTGWGNAHYYYSSARMDLLLDVEIRNPDGSTTKVKTPGGIIVADQKGDHLFIGSVMRKKTYEIGVQQENVAINGTLAKGDDTLFEIMERCEDKS